MGKEHPERLCGHDHQDDIDMCSETVKTCIKCKDDSCPVKTITLAQLESDIKDAWNELWDDAVNNGWNPTIEKMKKLEKQYGIMVED